MIGDDVVFAIASVVGGGAVAVALVVLVGTLTIHGTLVPPSYKLALKPASGASINGLNVETNQPHDILNDLGWKIYRKGLYNLIMHIKTQWNKPSVSLNWNRSSNTWYRSFNELESPNDFFNIGDRGNLNSPYNIGRLLDKDHRFITLDFDLLKILFPDKYRIILFTQYRDRSFWTVDFTDWITIPLPRLVISSFPNPLFLPRGEQATVEVQLNASSGYESDVHLYTPICTSSRIRSYNIVLLLLKLDYEVCL